MYVLRIVVDTGRLDFKIYLYLTKSGIGSILSGGETEQNVTFFLYLRQLTRT